MQQKFTHNRKFSPCAPAFFFYKSTFSSGTLWTLGVNINIFPLAVPLSVFLYPWPNHGTVSSGADWYHRCWQRQHLLSCIRHHLAKRSDGLFQNCPQLKSIGKLWAQFLFVVLLLVMVMCLYDGVCSKTEARNQTIAHHWEWENEGKK